MEFHKRELSWQSNTSVVCYALSFCMEHIHVLSSHGSSLRLEQEAQVSYPVTHKLLLLDAALTEVWRPDLLLCDRKGTNPLALGY